MNNIKKIETIIKNGSTRIDDHFALGDLYFGIGRFEKIVNLYNKALTLKPTNLDQGRIFYELAEALQLLNKFDESTVYFNKAICAVKGINNLWETLYIKGCSYYNLFLSCMDAGKINHYKKKSIHYYSKLIDKHAEHSDIYHVYSAVADIYSKQSEHDMALHYYNLALENVTDDFAKVQILSGIASIYGLKKQSSLCKQFYTDALEIANEYNSSKVYYDMGVTYFNDGLFKEANKIFKIALETKAIDKFLKNHQEYEIDIFWHLGAIAYELGINKNDVVHYLGKVLALINIDHFYYSNVNLTLGHFYSSIHKRNEAIEHYSNVLAGTNASEEELKVAKSCLSGLSHNG